MGHETRNSVPCYIGNPDRDNDNDADVTVSNIVIKDEVEVSCDERSDCPAILPFCFAEGESFGVLNGICTVCDECESYDDGIDGTCGPCGKPGKGYLTMEKEPSKDERLFSGDDDIESRLVDALRKAGEENKQGMTEQDIGEMLVEGLTMMLDEDSPSSSPTASPSVVPSASPSASPSVSPTASPSSSPMNA